MKTIFSYFAMGLGLAVVLSGCEYSNDFAGTYNNSPATLNAYSSNVQKYCVALTLTSGPTTLKNFVSAQAVYDDSNWLNPKIFNTKGAQCSANMTQYLAGTRSVNVISTSQVQQVVNAGPGYCQDVRYTNYTYQEALNFEVHDNSTDALVGTFSGTSSSARTYTDTNHGNYGQVYRCGGYGYPGYPYPGPGYPGYPYPGPGYPGPVYPGPHPGPIHPGPHPFSPRNIGFRA